MPVADRKGPSLPVPATDDDRNQRSAERIGSVLAEAVRSARRAVSRVQRIVDDAPGSKTAVFAKLGVDQSESDTILAKVLDLANTHKPTGEADLPAPS